jgi:uncharacterized alkaline shock family protein YloU
VPTGTVSAAGVAGIAAEAALGTVGVLALHGGAIGEVATYGDGGRVEGVRLRPSDGVLTLHVVVEYGRPVDEVSAELRRRVRAALAQQAPSAVIARIDVHVADVRPGPPALPAETAAVEPAPAAPGAPPPSTFPTESEAAR